MTRRIASSLAIPLILSIASLLTACAAGTGNDNDDDDECDTGTCGVDQTCSDPRYDNGTCDTTLDCAVPDIDCFRTFDDDASAATWFAELEVRAAQAEGRPARNVLAASDPRFPKVRALLDRGWEAMRVQRSVGKLAKRRPALVFVEDETVNAFVFPEDLDKQRASLAVMVHSATLDLQTSDDASLGLMMHELQHAVGLHVIAGIPERIASFYLASPDAEPIGRRQRDDADVREAVTLWRTRAGEIGPFSNAALGGLPTGGDLARVFRTAFGEGVQGNPNGCARASKLFKTLTQALEATIDPISSAPLVSAGFEAQVDQAFAALRDECLDGYPKTFVDVVAQISGATPAQIEASLSPEDKALIANKHIVDALAALAVNRRAAMRTIEQAVETGLGKPWSLVRYFSEEEDADDASVPVLRGAGLDPTGLRTFFLEVLMTPAASAACRDVLATGVVPAYGVDLLDTHHGNCWRTYHVDALAADTAKDKAKPRSRTHLAPQTPYRLPIAPVPTFAVY